MVSYRIARQARRDCGIAYVILGARANTPFCTAVQRQRSFWKIPEVTRQNACGWVRLSRLRWEPLPIGPLWPMPHQPWPYHAQSTRRRQTSLPRAAPLVFNSTARAVVINTHRPSAARFVWEVRENEPCPQDQSSHPRRHPAMTGGAQSCNSRTTLRSPGRVSKLPTNVVLNV